MPGAPAHFAAVQRDVTLCYLQLHQLQTFTAHHEVDNTQPALIFAHNPKLQREAQRPKDKNNEDPGVSFEIPTKIL